jgi:hypothetical protein
LPLGRDLYPSLRGKRLEDPDPAASGSVVAWANRGATIPDQFRQFVGPP